MKSALLLKKSGDIVEVDVSDINLNSINSSWITSLKTKIPNKGINSSFSEIDYYNYKKQLFILWGYSDGNAGQENIHELPPPLDKRLLFGDIVVASFDEVTGILNNLNVSLYEDFYKTMYGGFEDLGSEDSELSDPDDMWRYNSEEDPDYAPSEECSSEEYISDEDADSY